jgi:c-di-GMP-binding flagellar brake protein YcgR
MSAPGKALKRALDRCQRRHPRYRAEFPVVVTLLSAGERQRLNGHCRDVSQAGMGVLIAAELELGEVVTLAFSLPQLRDSWEVRAVIRHRRSFHYGFEFLALSDNQDQALIGYLRELDRADSDEAAPSL